MESSLLREFEKVNLHSSETIKILFSLFNLENLEIIENYKIGWCYGAYNQ